MAKGIEYVNAIVQRGNHTQVPVYVPAYEVPVLEAIHNGRDEAGNDYPAVFVKGEPELVETEFDPQDAYNALRRKYGNQERYIASVYRSPADLARAVKVIDIGKRKKADPESIAA